MKHQLDATLYRFYFCRVTLHVSGASSPSSGVFKTSTAATGTCVIVAGKSSHLLIRAGTRAWFPCTINFNYAVHSDFLRMVLLTDVYRNVTSLRSNDL